MRLVEALGDLVDVPQFFIWRLTLKPGSTKYEKVPCYPSGSVYNMDASDPANWMDYQAATATLHSLRATGGTYALGWYLTADSGYWFFDVDGCIKDGVISDIAKWAYANLNGAFSEISASGTGLHFIGHGSVPQHSMVNKACALELYTEGRGIAFGLNDEAEGCADSVHTQAIAAVAAHWFPYVQVAQVTGIDPTWRGPTDDDELLRRAMKSGSVGSMLGNRAAFKDLWERNVPVLAAIYPPDPGSADPYGASEVDGALAMQLAFWTGRDVARVERLMRRSALVRDKWDSERQDTTYLGFTVLRACRGVSNVCIDKEVVQQSATATTEDSRIAVDLWEQRIITADEQTLRNEVLPAICADQTIAVIDRERLATAVQKWFKEAHDMKLPIRECRAMVRGAVVSQDIEVKAFAGDHVYVEQGDMFFNIKTADMLTRTAFQARYNREMPPKANGDREDAAKWCLERWGTMTVHDTMYVPSKDPVFNYGTRKYANLFSQSTVPEVADYTPEGIEAIQVFAKHLELFCGGRPEVYGGLLAWMAFNVQNPGRKIRYAPLLKGIPGDGKSVVGQVLKAAMGVRNVSEVGPKLVANSGGFTDWAHGACVIALEEMMMKGKDRHAIANAIKENITNDHVTINRKHKGQLPIINVSNFIGSTNHSDAAPIEEGDRRWWVIFSPFSSISTIAQLHGVEDFPKHFNKVSRSVAEHGGQWRRWLLSLEIPSWFDPDSHAPITDEKLLMMQSGEDVEHSIARQVLESGAPGVTKEALSSAELTRAMQRICLLENTDVPKGSKVNLMLNDLKFQALCTMKIHGKIHRVWAKPGVSRDRARELIEQSYQVSG